MGFPVLAGDHPFATGDFGVQKLPKLWCQTRLLNCFSQSQNDPGQLGIYVFGVGAAALEAGLLRRLPKLCEHFEWHHTKKGKIHISPHLSLKPTWHDIHDSCLRARNTVGYHKNKILERILGFQKPTTKSNSKCLYFLFWLQGDWQHTSREKIKPNQPALIIRCYCCSPKISNMPRSLLSHRMKVAMIAELLLEFFRSTKKWKVGSLGFWVCRFKLQIVLEVTRATGATSLWYKTFLFQSLNVLKQFLTSSHTLLTLQRKTDWIFQFRLSNNIERRRPRDCPAWLWPHYLKSMRTCKVGSRSAPAVARPRFVPWLEC